MTSKDQENASERQFSKAIQAEGRSMFDVLRVIKSKHPFISSIVLSSEFFEYLRLTNKVVFKEGDFILSPQLVSGDDDIQIEACTSDVLKGKEYYLSPYSKAELQAFQALEHSEVVSMSLGKVNFTITVLDFARGNFRVNEEVTVLYTPIELVKELLAQSITIASSSDSDQIVGFRASVEHKHQAEISDVTAIFLALLTQTRKNAQ